MSYPPDPNNPYGQQPPQQPGYGYPQQQPPADAAAYGYPQQQPPAAGYGYPQGAPAAGYGVPPQAPYGAPVGGRDFYAHWGLRLGAAIIDYLIIYIPNLVIGLIAGMVGAASASSSCDAATGTCSSSPGVAMLAIAAVGYLYMLGMVLFQLYRQGTTGQTIGKKLVGIRVVREADGQVLGFGMAFVRQLCHAVDSFTCCVGYLWPLWDEKKQTLADKIMKSIVVKA